MSDAKLRHAEALYKQGNKTQAATLLAEIVRQDPTNSEAWYSLALSLNAIDRKIYCLKMVVALEPSHQEAQQLLKKLLLEQKPSPARKHNSTPDSYLGSPQEPMSRSNATKLLGKSAGAEKKPIYLLAGVLLLLVLCISIMGIATLARQVQAKNAQATATAEYLSAQATATAEYVECSERFKDVSIGLLSQFFRQESIAEVTARINLPEQIARLEQIRTETWNIQEKSCHSRVHSLLMDYMDKSIATYISFAADDDDWIILYVDSILALSKLDDEVIRVFDKGGLVGLFRAKGYFYWEGLDDPNWKNDLGS